MPRYQKSIIGTLEALPQRSREAARYNRIPFGLIAICRRLVCFFSTAIICVLFVTINTIIIVHAPFGKMDKEFKWRLLVAKMCAPMGKNSRSGEGRVQPNERANRR